jgi:IclR family KDG regulon transcriptional repressor
LQQPCETSGAILTSSLICNIVSVCGKHFHFVERSTAISRSVLKALHILETLARTEEGLSLSELAEQMDYPVSTTHRLLATLAERGYVERDPDTRRYQLGVKILTLQTQGIRGHRLVQRAFPQLNTLKQQVHATVNLGVLSENEVVYLETFVPDGSVGFYLPPGTRMPSYCTALGKVLLAHLPRDALEALLPRLDLAPCTPYTITSETALRADLDTTARQGYALDDQEFNVGIRCLAAPIRDRSGTAIAGASMTVPAEQLPNEKIETTAALVTQACQRISRALGYQRAGL